MSNQRDTANSSIRRKRYSFWMDRTKSEDRAVEELITTLKDNRLFTQSIREGLQLIADLRNGNLDVLFTLFPWVQAEFLEYMRDLQHDSMAPSTHSEPQSESPPDTTPDSALSSQELWLYEKEQQIAAQWEYLEREKARLAAERERNQSAIEKKLEKLEQMLLAQGNRPLNHPSSGRGGGLQPVGGGGSSGPASLGAPDLPPPNFDDDDDDLLTVEKDDGSTSNANLNFIRSVQKLMEL